MGGEVDGEPIQATLAAGAPLSEPRLGFAQGLRLKVTAPHASDLLGAHEAALLEQPEVLHHAR
jgi:hypothetical protein